MSEVEVCDVCDGTLAEHKDRHHKFVRPGGGELLQPLDKPAPKKLSELTPLQRAVMAQSVDQHSTTMMRLLTKLRNKGLVDNGDIVEVLTGEVPSGLDGALDR